MLASNALADTAYINAKIYDGERHLPHADAFLISQGNFLKIATSSELKKLDGRVKIIDLKGARVMPGFIESHAHLLGLGQSKINLDFRNKKLSEILKMLKNKAEEQPAGTFIRGRNWDQNHWEKKEFPNAAMLKKVSKTHPIYLRRVDGHAAWLNTIALKIAGINKNTPDPKGGEIVRDEHGEPTGILIDNAMTLIEKHLKKPSRSELELFLKLGQEEALSHGITSFHDAGVNRETLELFIEKALSDDLALRLYAMLDGEDQDLVTEYLNNGPKEYNNKLKIRSIKYFADGALGSRGAFLLEDYSDKKGHKGLSLIDQAALTKKTVEALKKGFQVATHAIGDGANRAVLMSYKNALLEAPTPNARLRIEHAQLVAPEDHELFAKLKVIASMQPIHCISDMGWVTERLGEDRLLKRAYAWRSLKNNGIALSFGSDAPVESINPLVGLYAAVCRQDEKGLKPVFLSEEQLTLKEALEAYYKNAAYAEFSEHNKARIAPGYLADFVVFEKDILNLAKKDFLSAKAKLTFVGGRLVYQLPA